MMTHRSCVFSFLGRSCISKYSVSEPPWNSRQSDKPGLQNLLMWMIYKKRSGIGHSYWSDCSHICDFQEFNCWFGVLVFLPGFRGISVGMQIEEKWPSWSQGYKHAMNSATGRRQKGFMDIQRMFFYCVTLNLCQPIIEPEIFLCL